MGRKPNASKLPVESSMLESMNPSLGKSEPSPAAREEEKGKYELEQKSTSRGKRKSGYYSPPLRRSQRKTPVLVTPDHDIETNVEGIIVSENENDETDTQMEKVWPEPDADEPSLKDKVDYIFQRLEALEKTRESSHAKVDENTDLGKTPTSASASAVYKMYTDSLKKLEALTEENRQLTGKLENALGKVEVWEKQSAVLVQLLEKLKDVLMISNLSKSTEAAVNASVQAMQNACAAHGGKRKRQT